MNTKQLTSVNLKLKVTLKKKPVFKYTHYK